MQHGKTMLVDNLVGRTHVFDEARTKRRAERGGRAEDGERYTDSRVDEQKRGLSIKASPLSLLLQTQSEKHYLFNLIDTPGHTCFGDEVSAGLRLADGVLLVVDCVEGVVATTERLIRHVLGEQLPLVLCLNQLDRLILELKMPPVDAYFKLRQVIEEVNTIILAASGGSHPRVSPEAGSVVFASATQDWCFSLESFASLYAEVYPGCLLYTSPSPRDS